MVVSCGLTLVMSEPGKGNDCMSKAHAFFLTLLASVLISVAVPISVALWRLVLAQVSGLGMFAYSTLLACVAAPFLYAMLRRMK
jgi:hypothetical protein